MTGLEMPTKHFRRVSSMEVGERKPPLADGLCTSEMPLEKYDFWLSGNVCHADFFAFCRLNSTTRAPRAQVAGARTLTLEVGWHVLGCKDLLLEVGWHVLGWTHSPLGAAHSGVPWAPGQSNVLLPCPHPSFCQSFCWRVGLFRFQEDLLSIPVVPMGGGKAASSQNSA